MAASLLREDGAQLFPELPGYMGRVREWVARYRGSVTALARPEGFCMRVCGLEDTIYADSASDELESWQSFYLPAEIEMTPLGAVDEFWCSLAVGMQLILLAGADGLVYAYENEVLHEVSSSVPALLCEGFVFPGRRRYLYGALFPPMTAEEREELEASPEVIAMRLETREFLLSTEVEFTEILARIEAAESMQK